MSTSQMSAAAARRNPESEELLDLHEDHARKTGVDRDGRARPARWSWIIPALVSLLVGMVFFSSLERLEDPTRQIGTAFNDWDDLPQVSKEILSDIKVVLGSQVRTFGTIALYALVPGLLGSIYRKKFWHWFLGAFGVLFVFNLIGFEFYEMSVSSKMLNDLYAPPGEPNASLQADYWKYVRIEAILLAVFLAFRLRRHVTPGEDTDKVSKNIVICLDGTWNHPGQTDWGYLAQTNVFKLFDALEERPDAAAGHHNAARCKRYYEDGKQRQVAFYYNGVGNKVENSWLGQKIGGAFGLGAEAIKERAYLDIAREWERGDRIFIFGFSRGAALARMVASALDKRGVPETFWTLRVFGRQRPLKKSKKHHQVKITVLGCWDTVGAFGVPKDVLGIPFQQINLLKDLTVPISVERAYHLVALDEDRDAFVPTLMDPDPVNPNRIVEVWFSGNHSNVGGGFATDGLSDHTLSFMLQHVSSAWDKEAKITTRDTSWGLYLQPDRSFKPNPLGKLRVSGGSAYTRFPRPVPLGAVFHDSVFRRIRDENSKYVPESLFVCNGGISKLRDRLDREVETLRKTRALADPEADEVKRWVDERLTITKWANLENRPRPAEDEGLANRKARAAAA